MCIHNRAFKLPGAPRKADGFSLIELVVFIVIVSTAVAGVLGAISYATRNSADPVVEKQALAVAESMLQEIESMPFTYCDPNDPAVSTATSAAGCATPEVMGPELGETRYSPTNPFNNVNDYNNFNMNPILDISGNPLTGLDAYTATVQVTQFAFGVVPVAGGLKISVTVTGPGSVSVTVEGYRAQYAPNAA